jgi:hypothetical protein
MAEVVETRDLTTPEQHGWAVDYRIRRDDGEELHAEVRCWDKARAAAERAANADALAAIADRGRAAAQTGAATPRRPKCISPYSPFDFCGSPYSGSRWR